MMIIIGWYGLIMITLTFIIIMINKELQDSEKILGTIIYLPIIIYIAKTLNIF